MNWKGFGNMNVRRDTGKPGRRCQDTRCPSEIRTQNFPYRSPERYRYTNQSQSEVRVTLRRAVYRQSVRLGAKPLETHDQVFFPLPLSPCGHSLYVTSSLTRGWGCLL
jgi:hypothetical protein